VKIHSLIERAEVVVDARLDGCGWKAHAKLADARVKLAIVQGETAGGWIPRLAFAQVTKLVLALKVFVDCVLEIERSL